MAGTHVMLEAMLKPLKVLQVACSDDPLICIIGAEL